MKNTRARTIGIRIEGIEAHVGLTLSPVHAHVMGILRDIYVDASMNAICCYAIQHMHSRLAEQGALPETDVTLTEAGECWESLQRFADSSNRELLKNCLMSLWAKHTF